MFFIDLLGYLGYDAYGTHAHLPAVHELHPFFGKRAKNLVTTSGRRSANAVIRRCEKNASARRWATLCRP